MIIKKCVTLLLYPYHPPCVRNGPDETHLMASAALSMNPDVIGGIEHSIVQACFTRSSTPQSIDDLAISGRRLIVLRAVCMVRMASSCTLIAVGGIFRDLMVTKLFVLTHTYLSLP